MRAARKPFRRSTCPRRDCAFKGFPTILGPFSYTDVRASLSWSLVNLNSLHNYLAARHNFAAAQLSAEDARELVVLTVGNAYLLVLADETQVASVEAQVATAKVSLDQAVDNHQAGTAPLLDELRARVDYQTLQQQLIVAENALEKDKLALARTIGLPLAQSFTLTDKAPYAAFDQLDVDAAIRQGHLNRKDLAAMVEQTKAAEEQRKAATADRLPTLTFNGDYGDIGTTLSHSHGTGDATGAERSAFQRIRPARRGGDCPGATGYRARPVERQERAGGRRHSRRAARYCSAQKQVEVARSSVDLASEALSEAQQRYATASATIWP
jgi:outer membrane protein TolC